MEALQNNSGAAADATNSMIEVLDEAGYTRRLAEKSRWHPDIHLDDEEFMSRFKPKDPSAVDTTTITSADTDSQTATDATNTTSTNTTNTTEDDMLDAFN